MDTSAQRARSGRFRAAGVAVLAVAMAATGACSGADAESEPPEPDEVAAAFGCGLLEAPEEASSTLDAFESMADWMSDEELADVRDDVEDAPPGRPDAFSTVDLSTPDGVSRTAQVVGAGVISNAGTRRPGETWYRVVCDMESGGSTEQVTLSVPIVEVDGTPMARLANVSDPLRTK